MDGAEGATSRNPVVMEPVPDVYLRTLLHLIDAGEINSMRATVMFCGRRVSGQLIGHETWRKSWAELLRGSPEELAAGGFSKFLAMIDRVYEEEKPGNGEPPRFLHFRDAHLSEVRTQSTVPLWRGRLSDVTGWTLF